MGGRPSVARSCDSLALWEGDRSGTAPQKERMGNTVNMEEMREIARERGTAAGSWIIDGNTTADTARAILAGYDSGDPEIMDIAPAPLSGEWAGESIPELFGLAVGEDWPDDETLTEFEMEFSDAFWTVVIRAARALID